MTSTEAVERSRAGLLVIAAFLTGVAGAATLIVSERYLGLDDFAPLAQLWTFWAVFAAGLTFSFQQWAAVHHVGRRDILVGGAAVRVRWLLIALSVGTLTLTGVFREDVFHSSSWVWPFAAAALPFGTALNGIRRGELARHQQRRGLASVIAGENLVRLLVTIALVALGAGTTWFAGALIAGFAVVFGPSGRWASERQGALPGQGVLGSSAVAGFLSYAFVFGAPLLLAIAGGDATEVSAVFLALTSVRVPFVVLQAVVPQLAVSLSTADEPSRAVRAVRRWIVYVAVVGSLVTAAVAFVLGDPVIGTIFGIRGELEPSTYALIATASVLAAGALVATVTLVVEGRSRRIAVAWAVPTATVPIVTASGALADPEMLALWLAVTQATVITIALTASRDKVPTEQSLGPGRARTP